MQHAGGVQYGQGVSLSHHHHHNQHHQHSNNNNNNEQYPSTDIQVSLIVKFTLTYVGTLL